MMSLPKKPQRTQRAQRITREKILSILRQAQDKPAQSAAFFSEAINHMRPEDFRSTEAPGRVVRHPNGYWAYIPNPLPPIITWSGDLVTALSAADRALGELAGLAQALPDPHLLIQPLIRREAVLSSRIEGTQASLADLYAYEAVQLTLFEFPEDVKEVRNYVRALQYGTVERDVRPGSQ